MNDSYRTAILVIGDEVLSGRTQDTNSGWLAKQLGAMGLPVGEIRTVADRQDEIVAAVNALRQKYKYVFTTGGIGPTHDDITADAIAAAFGLELVIDEGIRAILVDMMGEYALNEARLRMARVPVGATLIDNPESRVPGFKIGNVHVMAGVPKIMRAMFGTLELEGGAPVVMRALSTTLKEGDLAAGLEAVQKRFADVALGSYPHMIEGGWKTQLLAKGTDAAHVDAALAEVKVMLEGMGDTPQYISAD